MLTISLPPQVETVIIDTAKTSGITAEQLITKTLSEVFKSPNQPKERPFNFDIDELDKAIHSGFVPVPKFHTAEQLADWLGGTK